jgi:hypothetical protein
MDVGGDKRGGTDQLSFSPWMVQLNPSPTNGLTKVSAADAFQVRGVAQEARD